MICTNGETYHVQKMGRISMVQVSILSKLIHRCSAVLTPLAGLCSKGQSASKLYLAMQKLRNSQSYLERGKMLMLDCVHLQGMPQQNTT